ncbi:hypothetical protein chiPu_0017125 [Chiloscyllium punctatum]|uniref:Uncharacterized protein n=1 Tax=Chiloscyllium punctatum TaxID=137246 RepID=A0A401T7J0_CHIPU|nr:hypothetical protein [Chiloscyllium punctatum]
MYKTRNKVHLGPDRDSDLETLPPTLHGAETGHPPLREPAHPETDDTDNVEEGTVRAAHPVVEISITTQTFYNKSYRDMKQGTDTKKTINETGEETADATAFMEGVVIEPVCLGQHERHRHPVLRNEKRLKPAPKVKGKPGRSDRVWSQEEVALLRELEVRFAGCKFINKSTGSILKTKTPKQISDKRRLLANIPTEVKNISEPTTGIDSHDSEAESVQESSDDQAQRQRASRKTPALIPKHRDQLTQAEEFLSARNALDTLALGIGLVDSITDPLMNSRKRQDKHKRPQKDRAKKDKRPGSNTGAKKTVGST